MTIFFYVYTFFAPLEYLYDKIKKFPGGINYLNVTIMVAIIGMCSYRSKQNRNPLVRSPLTIPLVIYVINIIFGLFQTSISFGEPLPLNPSSESFTRMMVYINDAVFFFAAAALLDTRRKMHHCLIAIALSSPIVFRSFFNQLRGMKMSHFDNDLRIGGTFIWLNSNEFAAFVFYVCIFAFIYAIYLRRAFLLRMLFLGCTAMYSYIILYSYSRGTQLAFGLSIVLIAFLRYRLILLVLVIAAATLPLWVPNSVKERWLMTKTESGELEESSLLRTKFAEAAKGFFLQSPLIGHGVGSFKLMNPVRPGMDTHNLYLRTLTESGVVGFIILALLWFNLLRIGFVLWRHGRAIFDKHCGFALMVATPGLMLANLFGDRFTYLQLIAQYWVIAGICARLYGDLKGYEPMDATLSPTPHLNDPVDGAEPVTVGADAREKPWITPKKWRRPRIHLLKPPKAPGQYACGLVTAPTAAAAPQRPSPKQPTAPKAKPSIQIVGQTNTSTSAAVSTAPPKRQNVSTVGRHPAKRINVDRSYGLNVVTNENDS